MKLYLNNKERSIPFLNLLDIMLTSILSSRELKLSSLDSILQIQKFNDPVMDFLNYYINDSNKINSYSEGTLMWIKNALYSAKGAPEVIEIIKESLNLDIEYNYDLPILDIKQIKKVEVKSIQLFCDKFRSVLYYLMYFGEFSMAIKELILRLDDNLTQTNYISIKGFVNLTSELENELLSIS